MLKINDTFKKLIPPLSIDEYSALETSILKEGVRDAIVTWNDFIIDGHNRYEIATRHGLSFKTMGREFASEDEVIIWMIDNQLARRNISDGIKYRLAVKKRDVLNSIGLKNMSVAGESFSPKEGLSLSDKPSFIDTTASKNDAQKYEEAQARRSEIIASRKDSIAVAKDVPVDDIAPIAHIELPQPQPKKVIVPHNTQKEIAKTLGWSTGKVAQADVVFRAETPIAKEIQQKVIDGDLTIKAAYTEIRAVEKKEARIETIQKQITAIEAGELPELKGLYDVIAIDPPWPYEGENKSVTSYDANGRRVANPYPEMSIEQIKNIELPLTDNSIVFLWTTHKFLPDAFDILKEWGMEYKATLVWDKQKIGMGAWLRMQCEFCLVGIKGKPYWDNTTYRDILSEARREHSRKPDGFFDMVDAITMGRKLEYFSREKRKGWEVFGNDTGKF